MNIALDYDRTFTEDPEGWLEFANIMRARGHQIVGVTMRFPYETAGMVREYMTACDKIFFTSRTAKKDYMKKVGVHIYVWIDDMPEWILGDAR